MKSLKPRSDTLTVLLSVIETVEPANTTENTDMATNAIQPAQADGGVNTSDGTNTVNAEAAIEVAQQALDASGIRKNNDAHTASTLLGNLENLSETLKSVLDIIVEKIDAVAEVG